MLNATRTIAKKFTNFNWCLLKHIIITELLKKLRTWLLRTPWKNGRKTRKNVYLEIGTFEHLLILPPFLVLVEGLTQFTKQITKHLRPIKKVLSNNSIFEKLVDIVFIHIGGGWGCKSWWFPKNSKIGFENNFTRSQHLKAWILQNLFFSAKPAFLNVYTSLQSQQMLILRKQYRKKII